MRSFLRDNSLSVAMLLLFIASLAGQVATGLAQATTIEPNTASRR